MKFDINDYKDKYAMHCKTEEEAKDFCEYLHSVGRRWCTDQPYITNTCYHTYIGNTVYTFNEGSYCDMKWHTEHGYIILEWSDFMNGEFTKADLKLGDVVKFRNERIGIVCEFKGLKTIITNDSWVNFENITEELTMLYNKTYDIIAVRRPHKKSECQFNAFEYEYGTLIYEREECREMTIEEACETLGRLFNEKIKIVTKESK